MLKLLLIVFALFAINSVLASQVDPGPCSKPMDIAFIVDKSGSVGRENLEKMKILMEEAVDYFGMSDQGNHYAIMEFGGTPRIIVNFNTFTGQQVKSANLKLKIKQMDRIDWGGGSFIDKALLAANSQLFTVGAGMRPNASKVALIVSDGIQSMDRAFFTPLSRAREGMKNKGVQLISVGIGEDVDVFELGEIAEEKNLFSYTFFSKPKAFQILKSQLCPTIWSIFPGLIEKILPAGMEVLIDVKFSYIGVAMAM